MIHLTKILAATALMTTLAACSDNNKDMSDDTNMAAETVVVEVKPAPVVAEPEIMVANPTVGGAAMYDYKTIVANASTAPNLTTLVTAVTQAQLVETLSGEGPFTVFAPTNTAFGKLPAATVKSLMMDENRADLQNVLTAHVVSGKITATDLIAKIMDNDGRYTATTVSGDNLVFFMRDGKVIVEDENGGTATVITADVMQSNGVVHVVDGVLVPK
ncbi:fasciclin domain-containing protein [Robiginitomaculum antarcticum]|uniref:fasciclin domain-containing protein n=1 Tax=Robiginitomaculum antarcticum TaxID=437507 RepID=UPI0003711AED|nr:fasciclin domain-containing protein [Robiginitomaculum antarcticum]